MSNLNKSLGSSTNIGHQQPEFDDDNPQFLHLHTVVDDADQTEVVTLGMLRKEIDGWTEGWSLGCVDDARDSESKHRARSLPSSV